MLWLILLLAGLQNSDRAKADQLYRAREFEQAARIYFDLLSRTPQDDGLAAITAQAMVDAGHSREALPLLKRCAEAKPADSTRQRYLARALVENNQMLAAEDILVRLTRNDPADGIAWFYLGALRYQNGYYPAALDIFDRVLAWKAEDPAGIRKLARVYRASSLAQVGRLAEAEAAVKPLLADATLASNVELLLTHTQILYETARLDAALAEAGKAIRADSGNALAHLWKARILVKLSRWAEAEAAARESARRNPQLTQPHTTLLEIYRRTGNTAEMAREAEWLRQAENRRAQP